MMDGWIKSYRKMFDNPVVCKDAEHLAVWVYLLHYAAHNGYDQLFHGERITINRGQVSTSRSEIAEKLHISESKVQRILKTFEIEQQIEQRTDRQKRIITLLNWDKYQKSEQRFEQRVNNDRTTSEQRVNDPIYNNIYNISNIDKNDKNVKKDNNIYNPPISPQGETWSFDKHSNVENANHIIHDCKSPYEISLYIQTFPSLSEAIMTWLGYKDEKKPRSTHHYAETGLRALLKKFYKAHQEFGDKELTRIVDESMASNYSGIVWDKMRKSQKNGIEEFLNG